MTRIFISVPRLRSETDYLILGSLRKALAEKGYEIISDDFESSILSSHEKSDNFLNEILFNSDVIISLLTESIIESKTGYNELIRLRNL